MADRKKRLPRARPGELLAAWSTKNEYGWSRDFGVKGDLIYDGGTGVHPGSQRFLHNVLSSKRCRLNLDQPERSYPVIYDNSILEELVARGYDITTLRFSIQKKAPEAAA